MIFYCIFSLIEILESYFLFGSSLVRICLASGHWRTHLLNISCNNSVCILGHLTYICINMWWLQSDAVIIHGGNSFFKVAETSCHKRKFIIFCPPQYNHIYLSNVVVAVHSYKFKLQASNFRLNYCKWPEQEI